MLQTNRDQSSARGGPSAVTAEEPSIAEMLAYALGVVRRQGLVVVLFALLGLALGAVFFLKAVPAYTATATLLVDTHKLDVLQQPAVSSEMSIQSYGAMESQVELLKSDQVALAVIKNLRLWEDPRFIPIGKPGLRSALLRKYFPVLFPERPPPTAEERMQLALHFFARNLAVNRVGITYAIEIAFEASNPALAAQVANAVADAYIDLQKTSEYDAARRASDWLEARIPELRAKSEAAQRAVVQYKNEHDIVETGSGQLMVDQRLSELNTKLNAARDETLKAKARLDQLSAIGGSEIPSSIGNESNGKESQNGILDRLRTQYLEIISKEAEYSGKYGSNNPAIVSLRNQKVQLHSEIMDEIQRLKETSKSDYAAAQLRESIVKKEFDAAVAQSQEQNQAQVKLRELEASARAYQDLYNTFLNRYNASLQQAASPVAEASVITPATPIIQADYKKTYKLAGMFPIAGLALGAGIALLRELLAGRVFRTSKSVQSRLRIACIGLLPKVEHGKRPRRRTKQPERESPPRSLVRGDRGISWTVADQPLSRFSEGIRSIKLAIELGNRSRASKVIGFISAVPHEGKSTVALAVGQLMARNGATVIVVDCDLRNPSLTRSVAPDAASGIVELVSGEASLENIVWTDRSTQLAFVPAIPHPGPPDPPAILSSDELKGVFDNLRKQYEFVLVDLSPLAPVIDACATTEFVDCYVLVIEWGRTTIDVVQHALRAAPVVSESILGAVLNKADIKELATYDPYLTGYYFYKGDQNYSHVDS
jgi:succinoglycan biosynthesis transport protein ExoP